MAVYLIDFENVTSAGISGIQRLTKEDKVYIFYTVNASNMSFAAHMNLLSSPAEVIYYNVTSGGKNALDFQLASFLGFLISKGEDKDFYIISNDKGYDHVKNFWERSGVAEGVTIHSSPSINRSLIPIEKPFTSKIQQQGTQQTVTQQNGVSLEQLEQMKAEADKYNARKKAEAEAAEAAEAVKKEENEGNISANTEKPAEEKGKKKKTAEKSKTKSANDEKNIAKKANETEITEEKPVKRRGRPKKQVTEPSEKETEKSAKAEEIPANEGKSDEKKAKGNASKASETKSAAKKPKTTSARGKTAAKKENGSDNLINSLRPLLAKADVKSEEEITNIANYFGSADGKQQFYRNLIALYGMERGVEIYRVIRTEYTNLTKLVKQ